MLRAAGLWDVALVDQDDLGLGRHRRAVLAQLVHDGVVVVERVLAGCAVSPRVRARSCCSRNGCHSHVCFARSSSSAPRHGCRSRVKFLRRQGEESYAMTGA